MSNYHPISMQIGTQTKKNILRSTVLKAEMMPTAFPDGRRRHVGKSSESYKMGNCHPLLMQIGTQTKKNMLILKNHNTGSVGQVSRWPPPCWKFKCVL
jgi:hypothetical protein